MVSASVILLGLLMMKTQWYFTWMRRSGSDLVSYLPTMHKTVKWGSIKDASIDVFLFGLVFIQKKSLEDWNQHVTSEVLLQIPLDHQMWQLQFGSPDKTNTYIILFFRAGMQIKLAILVIWRLLPRATEQVRHFVCLRTSKNTSNTFQTQPFFDDKYNSNGQKLGLARNLNKQIRNPKLSPFSVTSTFRAHLKFLRT